MGNWQLEVGRMTLYIFFPIGIYYYLNYTDSVEEWVTNERRKHNDIFDEKRHLQLKQFIEELSHKQQKKRLAELEAEYLEGKAM